VDKRRNGDTIHIVLYRRSEAGAPIFEESGEPRWDFADRVLLFFVISKTMAFEGKKGKIEMSRTCSTPSIAHL